MTAMTVESATAAGTTGTTGTTVTHLPAGHGRSLAMLGDSLTFKAEPGAGGNTCLLFEHYLPAGLGVPPHTEANYEAFYVLEGTLDVEAGGERYRLGAGDFLGVPAGVAHGQHNPGPGAARSLTLISPGANHVRFFTTLGQPIVDPANPPAPSGPPDIAHLSAVARECGIQFLPPTGH
jgi:quercetin dioxygenase-like cupin family protein